MTTQNNPQLEQAIRQLAKDARAASRGMARASTEQKNNALLTLATLIQLLSQHQSWLESCWSRLNAPGAYPCGKHPLILGHW